MDPGDIVALSTASSLCAAVFSGTPFAIRADRRLNRRRGRRSSTVLEYFVPYYWVLSWFEFAAVQKQHRELDNMDLRARRLDQPEKYNERVNAQLRQQWDTRYRWLGEQAMLGDQFAHPDIEPPQPTRSDPRYPDGPPCTESTCPGRLSRIYGYTSKPCHISSHIYPRPDFTRTSQLLATAPRAYTEAELRDQAYEMSGAKDTDDLIRRLDATLNPPRPLAPNSTSRFNHNRTVPATDRKELYDRAEKQMKVAQAALAKAEQVERKFAALQSHKHECRCFGEITEIRSLDGSVVKRVNSCTCTPVKRPPISTSGGAR